MCPYINTQVVSRRIKCNAVTCYNPKDPKCNLTKDLLVADCDVPTINQLKCSDYAQIDGLIPEPHLGDPGAPVYLLLGNPGGYYPLNKIQENILRNVLVHKERTNPYLLPYFCCHPGHFWTIEKFQRLAMDAKVPSLKHLKIFVIEFFPFHSDSIKPFMKNPTLLPSYQYYNRLILNAIATGKYIIVGRMYNQWDQRLGGALSKNTNGRIIKLNSPQNVILTQKNMGLNNNDYDALLKILNPNYPKCMNPLNCSCPIQLNYPNCNKCFCCLSCPNIP